MTRGAIPEPDPLAAIVAALSTPVEGDLRERYHDLIVDLEDRIEAIGAWSVSAAQRVHGDFLVGAAPSRDLLAEADVCIAACRSVDAHVFVLLARESPVGEDLRRVVAVMRTAIEQGRTARLLQHIAELGPSADAAGWPSELRGAAERLVEAGEDVLARASRAWSQRDALAFSEVAAADAAVDRARDVLVRDARSSRSLDPAAAMAAGLFARYVERNADHALEAVRNLVFAVTGERVVGGVVR